MKVPFNGQFPLTQPFGVNPQDYAKFKMIGHNGLDYGLPTGTQVVAATDGTVTCLEDPGGFGYYIEVWGQQYRTIYAHLEKFLVVTGQHVLEGQPIALSNNTGNSTGPHLHFGVKPLNPDKNNGYFGAIDPQPILQGEPMQPVSQQKPDALVAQLSYNLAFNVQPTEADLASHDGQTTEQLMRSLLESEQFKQYVADHDLGVKAREGNWQGDYKPYDGPQLYELNKK